MITRRRKSSGPSRIRLYLAFLFPFLLTSLIIYRAVDFQIIKREELRKKLVKQREKVEKLVPRRGRILDAKGNEIAQSVKVGSVYARTRAIKDKEKVVMGLSKKLEMEPRVIRRLLSEGNNFVWLKRQIPQTLASEISQLKIPGIEVIWEYKRFYPNKELAAQVIGFTGWDSQGLEGLEYYFDNYLQSEPEFLNIERDAYGQEIITDPQETRISGNDIILTLDMGVQFVVEDELNKTAKRTKAKNLIGIVMDVKSGAILALAQYPGFNPNAFKNYPSRYWRNLGVSSVFEPGSTFKIFLVAAALQEGVVKPDTLFYCENGEYNPSSDIVIHDVKKYSYLTVEDIIAYSSNIGAAKIAQKLGKEKYMNFIREFGFGARTGIELPAEEKGIVRPIKKTTDVDNMILGFGQGISVTPIQLITAFNSLVNDGVLVKPYILKSILSPDGTPIYTYLPPEGKRVVSEQVARKVKRMLRKVVTSGTGQAANIEGYGSAGKTGTSQKIDPQTGKYSEEHFTSYFIGYTPYNDPRVSILIIVDEPEGTPYGGVVAAPAFKNIGERILPLLNEKGTIADTGEPLRIALNEDTKTREGASIENGAGDPLASGGTGIKQMPDLLGLGYREVLELLSKTGIKATISGNGFVVEQTPLPGTVINKDQKCLVKLSPLI